MKRHGGLLDLTGGDLHRSSIGDIMLLVETQLAGETGQDLMGGNAEKKKFNSFSASHVIPNTFSDVGVRALGQQVQYSQLSNFYEARYCSSDGNNFGVYQVLHGC